MKRLTGKTEFGITSYNPETDYVAGFEEMRERLYQYENTGLTPKEIVKKANDYSEIFKMGKELIDEACELHHKIRTLEAQNGELIGLLKEFRDIECCKGCKLVDLCNKGYKERVEKALDGVE